MSVVWREKGKTLQLCTATVFNSFNPLTSELILSSPFMHLKVMRHQKGWHNKSISFDKISTFISKPNYNSFWWSWFPTLPDYNVAWRSLFILTIAKDFYSSEFLLPSNCRLIFILFCRSKHPNTKSMKMLDSQHCWEQVMNCFWSHSCSALLQVSQADTFSYRKGLCLESYYTEQLDSFPCFAEATRSAKSQ